MNADLFEQDHATLGDFYRGLQTEQADIRYTKRPPKIQCRILMAAFEGRFTEGEAQTMLFDNARSSLSSVYSFIVSKPKR